MQCEDGMNESGGKCAALYTQVSAIDESCDPPLEGLRKFAGHRFSLYREYVDLGQSGAQRRRPQLDALMRDAKKRLFDAVLVWKFGRFARSATELIEKLDELSSLGIDFISYADGIDSTTLTCQPFQIVGAIARFQRELVAHGSRTSLFHIKPSGKHVDAARVARLRSSGNSLRTIAKTLDIPVSRVRRALVHGDSR
jgi:DNA invertase Pin-like site-specific DNA recombinase